MYCTSVLLVDVTYKHEVHSFGGFKWFKEMPESMWINISIFIIRCNGGDILYIYTPAKFKSSPLKKLFFADDFPFKANRRKKIRLYSLLNFQGVYIVLCHPDLMTTSPTHLSRSPKWSQTPFRGSRPSGRRRFWGSALMWRRRTVPWCIVTWQRRWKAA